MQILLFIETSAKLFSFTQAFKKQVKAQFKRYMNLMVDYGSKDTTNGALIAV